MPASRLLHAFDTGFVDLPDAGRVPVYGPCDPVSLIGLDPDRFLMIARYRPFADAARDMGLDTALSTQGPTPLAIVVVPRSRDLAHALIAEAAATLTPGGTLVIDGQKTDGIESILKEVRARVPELVVESRAHGKIAVLSPPEQVFAAWQGQDRIIEGGFVTRPGVFSADAADPASVLLAARLPEKLGPHVIDLGAGWGFLSRSALQRASVTRLDLIEADATALDCARANVQDPRARFHWADAMSVTLDARADDVICNPPFHNGRSADPGLGMAFIVAARRLLSVRGRLWLVANRHLPYGPVLAKSFAEVVELEGSSSYRLYRAARPLTGARLSA